MPRPLVIVLILCLPVRSRDAVTYDGHILPIFQQSCLNCHNPDKTKGGLDLSSYAATLKGGSGGKVVEPGEIGGPLVSCVLQSGEKKMPPEGDKLANSQIDTLKRWIEGGLLENKSSSARKPTKPKFETALRSSPGTKPDGPPPMPLHLLLEPCVVTHRPASIHSITASPWAPLLAITGQHQILLYHTESLDLVGILPFPEGEPISLSFTPDARYLIAGGGVPGKSGITITFDITNGTRLLTAGKEFDTILAADILPGFENVATGGPSRLLKIWNTETGGLVKSIKKHTDWITALDLSEDGVLLASGDRNGGVWVWESVSASEFHTLRGHQAAISAASFRADSNILATTSEDGTVRFWEMNGGSEVKKIDAHPGGVTAFAFARDGSSVTAGRDFKLKFWKPDFSHARDLAQNLPALPTAVAIDFEAKRAFVADAQGIVRVFQTADGKAAGQIHANPPTVAARLQRLTAEITEGHDLPRLKSEFKRWSAAEVNTRAITARREADIRTLELEKSNLEFSQAAAGISLQSTALNLKRNAREQLANQFNIDELIPQIASELQATLVAIDLKISLELGAQQAAENRMIESREALEKTAPAVHGKTLEAESLRAEYHRALE